MEAKAIFEKAWQGSTAMLPPEAIVREFAQEVSTHLAMHSSADGWCLLAHSWACGQGPLGLFITDTSDGCVVITGPKERGFELNPEVCAAWNAAAHDAVSLSLWGGCAAVFVLVCACCCPIVQRRCGWRGGVGRRARPPRRGCARWTRSWL